jgi:hypothetical protein
MHWYVQYRNLCTGMCNVEIYLCADTTSSPFKRSPEKMAFSLFADSSGENFRKNRKKEFFSFGENVDMTIVQFSRLSKLAWHLLQVKDGSMKSSTKKSSDKKLVRQETIQQEPRRTCCLRRETLVDLDKKLTTLPNFTLLTYVCDFRGDI